VIVRQRGDTRRPTLLFCNGAAELIDWSACSKFTGRPSINRPGSKLRPHRGKWR